MTTATAGSAPAPKARGRMNRFDSPWLNGKFLIGLGMVLVVAGMGIYGPWIWDTDLARVASSPLNLPPPWAPGFRDQVQQTEAAPAAAPTQAAAPADAATDTEAGGTTDAVEAPADTSITGGNPLQQQQSGSGSGSGSGGITGGNPFQQQQSEGGDSGSITGGNPLQQQQQSDGAADDAVEAAPTPAPALTAQQRRASRFGTPTWDHPLGTESSGRDMLAVLLVGAPRSLRIGIIAAGIGMLVGILLGFTAGFLGGWIDSVIRTLADAFITIPGLAVLIVISAYVSLNNINYMAMLLALFAWPGPTRLIRSQVLSMRERGYVQMARLSGASTTTIMFGEMMPNLLPYLASSFTGNVSAAILAATGLEVLGLGPTRDPTLGITIFYAIRSAAILRGMWWWWGVPIVALIIIFTGLFLMTIGLDEIANPRLRGVKSK